MERYAVGALLLHPSSPITQVYEKRDVMTAWQRSNITERAEKGIGPISFKRLLLAGGASGIVAIVGGRAMGFIPSCLSGVIILTFVLVITHPVEGMPLLAFALRSLHGLATVAAIHDTEGIMSNVGQAMRVSPEDGILQADAVFDAVWEDEHEEDLVDAEWEYLGGFEDVRGEGLAAADNPFASRKGID